MKMAMALLGSLLVAGSSAFAGTEFHCEGQVFNGQKVATTLAGTITSDTTAADVVFSLDGETGFKAAALIGTTYKPVSRKYKNMMKMKAEKTGDVVIYPRLQGYSSITLLMPKELTKQNRFAVYVRETSSDGGSTNALSCFAEN